MVWHLISWADIHESDLFHPEIVLYFLNWPICTAKYRFVSILETLAAYPWSCTCCTSHRQMIDSPSLQQLDADWSVGTSACAGGHLWNDWQLNRITVGMSLLRIHICTRTATEDPPFCTCTPPKIHPFAHVTSKRTPNPVMWLVTINKSGTNQRMLIWELTLYKAMFWHVQHHSELIFGCHNKNGQG